MQLPREVADIIPAVSRRVGKPIRVIRTRISTEGFTKETSDEYIVYISQSALQQMTLAHELGHIVMGHACISLGDEIATEGPLTAWSQHLEKSLAESGKAREREADIFADQLLTLLELTRARVSMSGLRFAIASTS